MKKILGYSIAATPLVVALGLNAYERGIFSSLLIIAISFVAVSFIVGGLILATSDD